jgi:hypothetical protein
MSTKTKWLIGAGIAGVLALTLVVGAVGFWLASSAVAQASTLAQSKGQGSCHDNQSVFPLLGLSEPELLAQRQAGKSLLEIAKAKGVAEDKLTNALLQPMNGMHSGSQAYVEQMTQAMRDQFAQDLRESKFGTMTDFHLGLGGHGDSNMTRALHQTQCGASVGGTDGKGMMNGVTTNGMMGNGTGRGMMKGQGMTGR